MTAEITVEQLDNAIAAARANDPFLLWEALPPGEGRRLPAYVYDAIKIDMPTTIAALEQWRDALFGSMKPDESSPKQLYARRAALKLSRDQAASLPGMERLASIDVACCETSNTCATCAQFTRAAYSAALRAEEMRQASITETWSARLLRLAQEAKASQDAYDAADRVYQSAARAAEDCRLARATAHERRWNAGQAFREATSMSAILEAARVVVGVDLAGAPDRTVEHVHSKPHYQAEEWVRIAPDRVKLNIDPFQVSVVQWLDSAQSWVYRTPCGAFISERGLVSTLNPALRETAQDTLAWLRNPVKLSPPHRRSELPGYTEWTCRRLDSAAWATQLEHLLRD